MNDRIPGFGTLAVHAGAQDYLVKGAADANIVTRSLRYACERARLRRSLIEREMAGDKTQWNELMAAAIVGSLPAMILYALLERYLVRGLTAGATKG